MKFQNKWKRSGVLDCHYSTPIEVENYLYGFHGRQERGHYYVVSDCRMEKLCGQPLLWELVT